MELNLTTAKGEAAGSSVQLSDDLFACPYNEALVHQAVTAFLAGGRSGTHAQKTRAQVRGGGAKPWRQKSTGRARAGSSRSPIWRSGGKTFAAVPANYQQKLNKKMYRAAMRSLLSELLRQKRLVIVEEFAMAAAKTRDLVARLSVLGLSDVVLVCHEPDENLYLSVRNVPWAEVMDVAMLDPVSLIRHEKILMTVDAVKQLEGRLG